MGINLLSRDFFVRIWVRDSFLIPVFIRCYIYGAVLAHWLVVFNQCFISAWLAYSNISIVIVGLVIYFKIKFWYFGDNFENFDRKLQEIPNGTEF